jgi:uncharacterized protein
VKPAEQFLQSRGYSLIGRTFSIQNTIVLACCDKELIGKTLEDKKIFLEVNQKFYGNKEITKKELQKALEEAQNINLLGKKSVNTAIEKKIAEKEDVIEIKGVPHLQIYRI